MFTVSKGQTAPSSRALDMTRLIRLKATASAGKESIADGGERNEPGKWSYMVEKIDHASGRQSRRGLQRESPEGKRALPISKHEAVFSLSCSSVF